VVEGTAGNTGIGLAHVCNALGYKCVIFMPDTQSKVYSLISRGYAMLWPKICASVLCYPGLFPATAFV